MVRSLVRWQRGDDLVVPEIHRIARHLPHQHDRRIVSRHRAVTRPPGRRLRPHAQVASTLGAAAVEPDLSLGRA